MLEAYRRRVAEGSVRQSLYAMRGAFLPRDIRDNPLAEWVMTFDDLRQRESGPSGFGDDDREPQFWALDQLVISTLQRQIPFYFASLFHIGRQWKVSESALNALENASTVENLHASTVLTFDNLRHDELYDEHLVALFEHGRDIAAEALAKVLESSRDEHAAQLQTSRRWWTEWCNEVGNLRRRVDGIGEIARRQSDSLLWREVSTFAMKGNRPSPLRATMEAAGIEFTHLEMTDDSQPMAFFATMFPLLFAALTMSDAGGSTARDIMYELRHVLDDINEESRYGKARRIALERLKQKHSQGEDPFEPYLPLRNPATEELQNLIIQHTLPGHRFDSPWLESWRRSVAYDSWSTDVSFKDVQDKTTLVAFARSADSAIKSNLPAKFQTGDTWKEVIQRLFESKWVRPTSIRLAETNKRRGNDVWDLKSFATLVDGVVGVMNDAGYGLSPISRTRFKSLWERSHGDKPWLHEEW